jgi:diaminopimelate epimerase
MQLRFTKMHGLGNDFVVSDATRTTVALPPERVRAIADRHFGVGCDQLLVVEPATRPDVDFRYRIFNSDGGEVEQCGNGARCFVRFVHDKGLSERNPLRVDTVNNRLVLQAQADGRVTVDMNAPIFEPDRVPFDASGLTPRLAGPGFPLWPLDLGDVVADVAVLSMGNPHAVLLVDDVDHAPVAQWGPRIEQHPRFPRKVNAGFLQIINRGHVKLRVHERDAGETLACGTGACAAVVAGIRQGLLDPAVEVDTRGGRLRIEWAGGDAHVFMTGPAQTVFEGEIEL